MPQQVLEEIGCAACLAAALEASGRHICFGCHPTTGLPTAVLHELDGTARVLPLSLVADPVALAAAVGAPLRPHRVGPAP